MLYLFLMAVTIALLIGFVALTRYEATRGVRVYAEGRARLDNVVERVSYVSTHVNLAAFLQDELKHFISRLGHFIAYLSLLVVRAIERFLTRAVRHFRTRPEIDTGSRETAREFVKTLSDFKNGLKATHPEIMYTKDSPP